MLTIYPSSRFKKSFKKMPVDIKKDFVKRIKIFSKNPFCQTLNTHKLNGKLGRYYAFYLRNGFRVLFDFMNSDDVLLVNIGSHDDYKKWSKSL